MDWATALVVIGVLIGWGALTRFILPRYGIQIG
jgi:hypothetical protein